MILKIIHPTRGPVGTVELKDGKVIKANGNQLRQMKRWAESSVREYAMRLNWIVTEEKDNMPK